MREQDSFWSVVNEIRRREPGFAVEAYALVMEALEYTIRDVGERRHVTAEELMRGLCGHARDRFGMLAYLILGRWGVRESRDVGAIVFQLVNAGVLSRRDSDRREDFDNAVNLRYELEDLYLTDRSGPTPEAN